MNPYQSFSMPFLRQQAIQNFYKESVWISRPTKAFEQPRVLTLRWLLLCEIKKWQNITFVRRVRSFDPDCECNRHESVSEFEDSTFVCCWEDSLGQDWYLRTCWHVSSFGPSWSWSPKDGRLEISGYLHDEIFRQLGQLVMNYRNCLPRWATWRSSSGGWRLILKNGMLWLMVIRMRCRKLRRPWTP